MMNYQMCESPSPVMGGGLFLSQWLVLDGLPSKANAHFINESNFCHDFVGSYGGLCCRRNNTLRVRAIEQSARSKN